MALLLQDVPSRAALTELLAPALCKTGNIVAGTADAVGGLLKTEAGVVVVGNLEERSVTDGLGTAVDGVVDPLLPVVDAGGQAVGEIVGAVSSNSD
jgi:hypothetical protein